MKVKGERGNTEWQRGAQEVRTAGYTVLVDLLPADLVADLLAAYLGVLDRHVAAATPTNRGVNRHQMYVPFEPPFSDLRLVDNPRVLAVVDAVLGTDAECSYVASDVPLPGADYQRPHRDTAELYPDHPHPLPAHGLALNVPLVDVDANNGPLECWPGTVALPGPPEGVEPLRFTVPAGTGILRDIRLWHRGSPNRSDAPRPMLAILYNRPWYRFPLDPPTITQARFDAMAEPVRRRFRNAHVVA